MMKNEHITLSALENRGWTGTLIRVHLGDPDTLRPNPRYPSAAPSRLYALARVEAIEQLEAWQAARDHIRQRQARAQAAAKTKRTKLLEEIEQLQIVILHLDGKTLTSRACENYNERQVERGNWHYDAATPKSDTDFLQRIMVNYLRHELSSYEDALERTHGKIGVREAYQAISRKVYAAIADVYPDLSQECDKQLSAKSMI